MLRTAHLYVYGVVIKGYHTLRVLAKNLLCQEESVPHAVGINNFSSYFNPVRQSVRCTNSGK